MGSFEQESGGRAGPRQVGWLQVEGAARGQDYTTGVERTWKLAVFGNPVAEAGLVSVPPSLAPGVVGLALFSVPREQLRLVDAVGQEGVGSVPRDSG